MARALSNIKLEITLDASGAPLGAQASYTITDGPASKGASYRVPTPDFTKVLHNMGSVGEFWRDVIDEIKTLESI